MYIVLVSVEEWHDNYGKEKTVKHLPTFFLNEHLQGITSENHARKIALEIVNPDGHYDAVNISVAKV